MQKLPDPANSQDAIPLKTVLEGEHLAKLIDEAVAFVKADKTDHSDSDIRASFVDQALLKKCGCIVANRYDSMVPYFAEAIIRTKLILMHHL